MSVYARCLSLQILLFLPCKICVISTYFISVLSSGCVSAVTYFFNSVWFSIVRKHTSCILQCIMPHICQQKGQPPTTCVSLFAPRLICSWVTKYYQFFIISASVFFHKTSISVFRVDSYKCLKSQVPPFY